MSKPLFLHILVVILYKSYISYTQLRDYLAILTEQGLVVLDHNNGVYRITDKGKKVLKLSREIGDIIRNGS